MPSDTNDVKDITALRIDIISAHNPIFTHLLLGVPYEQHVALWDILNSGQPRFVTHDVASEQQK